MIGLDLEEKEENDHKSVMNSQRMKRHNWVIYKREVQKMEIMKGDRLNYFHGISPFFVFWLGCLLYFPLLEPPDQ
jgi:hypothetical protein